MTTTDVQARLAQPLPYPTPPAIVTPAMRAADDAYRSHIRAQQTAHEAMVDDWYTEALEKTLGPLAAWLDGEDA